MLIIKGGQCVDPENDNSALSDDIKDIIIDNGIIVEIISPGLLAEKKMDIPDDAEILDASGKIVAPGLMDMHVHLREPGHEYKETIASGCLAAASGGFTAVCSMPNTNPVNDNRQVTEFITQKAEETDLIKVYPVAAISKGLAGNKLNEYGELKEAGAIALSDDGNPVINSQFMRKAMEYAKGFGLLIISHCEVPDLVAGGVMNEGPAATRAGLAGIPNSAESIMVMRDIALCELTGHPLHIAHVSTKESVHAIRDAKKRGVPVTAETAPHYFTLTDNDIIDYNTNAKMNPPLRSEKDRCAILEGLADGTIDVIATDHAPHSSIEKNVEFDLAANGIVGLETAVPLGLKLVEKGIISLETLIKKMSVNPASILGIKKGLKTGLPADITVIDPDITYSIDADNFYSLGRNTPFNGWKMKGKSIATIVNGKIIYKDMDLTIS